MNLKDCIDKIWNNYLEIKKETWGSGEFYNSTLNDIPNLFMKELNLKKDEYYIKFGTGERKVDRFAIHCYCSI